MKLFVRELKNYKHTFWAANYERIVRAIEETDDACCVSLYRTPEREKFIEFTIPVRLAPSNAVIILQSQMERFKTVSRYPGPCLPRSVAEKRHSRRGRQRKGLQGNYR